MQDYRKVTRGDEKALGETKDTSHPERGRAIHKKDRKLDAHTWSLQGKGVVNNLREKLRGGWWNRREESKEKNTYYCCTLNFTE